MSRIFSILVPYLRDLNLFWVAVSFALTLVCWVVMRKQNRRHVMAVRFAVLYLCIVYTSTVLSRDITQERGWALIPFWSYDQWMQGNDVFLTYIVLNILMLLPVDFSLSLVRQDTLAGLRIFPPD